MPHIPHLNQVEIKLFFYFPLNSAYAICFISNMKVEKLKEKRKKLLQSAFDKIKGTRRDSAIGTRLG
ncbi:MAG: hypothetical protein CR997_13565 [Acidobacteria bacterium]|nr:MAG: hypothetical protein CR997_13565 [Acidobacteriota bacterium]